MAPSSTDPDALIPSPGDLQRVLHDLRAANERLVLSGIQLQELADAAQAARAEAEAARRDAEHARTQADEASRQKDEFMAVLGHELRNPLSPIAAALQLLRMQGVSSPEVEIIDRQVAHLTRLVDDLLDIARVTQGRLELRTRPVDLVDALGRSVEAVRPLVSRSQQVLEVEVEPDGLPVLADPERLTQIFTNLLVNASRFSPAGGRITVSAARVDETAVVRVRDRGVGIEPGMLERIFGSFVQQRQSSDRPRGGLGLGLAIARNLARLHGGRLYACSEGAGQGSEFVLELPVLARAADMAAPPAPAALEGDSSSHGTRVLVVDDNWDSAEMLVQLLKAFGYEVEAAHDGREALSIAERFQPDVALLDIGLPEMDGYQVAEELRGLELRSQPTFVALTGYGQEKDRQRSARAGFAAHLVKPVEASVLMTAVRRASDRSHS
jgi:signal transduction histidine kinase/ActR/RegA family two-component response regulator